MRNTLRLLGIIALVALIGFGLMACNDGSSSSDEEKVANKDPTEGDYLYYGHEQVYDGTPKAFSIVPKSGKSTGKVTVYYNGNTNQEPPTVKGRYKITFDVAAAPGWNAVYDLAGKEDYYMEIVEQSQWAYTPVLDDFDIVGLGRFPYEDARQTARAVVVTPKAGKSTGAITVSYARWNEKKDDDGNKIYEGKTTTQVTQPGEYCVTFTVGSVVGWFPTEIIAGELVIFASTPVTAQDYDISGQSQIFAGNAPGQNDTRRYMKIVPRPGKSKGNITIYYKGMDGLAYGPSITAPWIIGKYEVTFDVAEESADYVDSGQGTHFKAAQGLVAGTLEIHEKQVEKPENPKYEDFLIEGAEGIFDNALQTYYYDGNPKEVSVRSKSGVSGVIHVYYTSNGYVNSNNSYYYKETPPTDAGQYRVAFSVGESHGYNAIGEDYQANLIQTPLFMTINPIELRPEDFEVRIGDYSGAGKDQTEIYARNVSIGEWKKVSPNTEIGPFTYKNRAYPVAIRNTKINKNENWVYAGYGEVSFEDVLYPTGQSNAMSSGPRDAGEYIIRFSFQNYTGVNWSINPGIFNVGKMTIQKALPTKQDYVTNIGQSFSNILTTDDLPNVKTFSVVKGTTAPVAYTTVHNYREFGLGKVATFGEAGATYGTDTGRVPVVAIPIQSVNNSDGYGDNLVASPGKVTIYYNGEKDFTKVTSALTGEKYKVTMDVDATTKEQGLNWLEAKGIDLGEYVIKRATPLLSHYAFDDRYFIQTAYAVKEGYFTEGSKSGIIFGKEGDGAIYPVGPISGDISPAVPSFEYSLTGAANSFSSKVPQLEGKYYVNLKVIATENWDAATIRVPNLYLGSTADEYNFGLTVNPFIIRNSIDLEKWLINVTDKPVDGNEGVFKVKMWYTALNSALNRVDTIQGHLKQYSTIKVNLDFTGTELANFTFGDDPDGTSATITGNFAGCTSLYGITTPPQLADTGDNCFEGCPLSDETQMYDADGNKLYMKYGFSVPKENELEGVRDDDLDLTLSSSLVIGAEAFKDTFITQFVIPSNLISIGEAAFKDVTSLGAIEVGEDESGEDAAILTTISDSAFEGCLKLKGVKIPGTVTTIGDLAFAGCDDLTRVWFLGEDPLPLWGAETFSEIAFDGNLKGVFNVDSERNGGAGWYTRHINTTVWTFEDKWGWTTE